tara:strand:+ start:275 stop:490 length:216 start_codon:yes stop_codon:yes gene_type:complete
MVLKIAWLGLFLLTILAMYLSGSELIQAKKDTQELVKNVEKKLVASYVPMTKRNWYFKHCTPTNKDCGRLE